MSHQRLIMNSFTGTTIIHHDNRLWKRDFKLGSHPGDISMGLKIRLLRGESIPSSPYFLGCSAEAARGYKREKIKKANRKFRHSFKNEELKKLQEELLP